MTKDAGPQIPPQTGNLVPQGNAIELRDDLAVMLAWWRLIATDVSPIEAADRLLSGPLAALRARAKAADRVRELADQFDRAPLLIGPDAADRLRCALDGDQP